MSPLMLLNCGVQPLALHTTICNEIYLFLAIGR